MAVKHSLILVAVIAATASPNPAQAKVIYNGVAAGDTTEESAVLWTRATTEPNTPVTLTVQVATDPGFTNIIYSAKGTTNADKDYTFKTQVKSLTSGQKYYYRFLSGTFVSPTGTFKTAPAKNQKVAVRFGFGGDTDGQWRPYPSTQFLGNLNLDFFIYLGDTIYPTAAGVLGTANYSPAAANPYTNTKQALIDYHRKYLENLLPVHVGGFAGLQALLATTGSYTLFDNQELGNKQFTNGGAPTGSPPGAGADATNTANDVNVTGRYINKTNNFQILEQADADYHPLGERAIFTPNDSRTNNTSQQFLAQQWGANVILINLDDRSYGDIRVKLLGSPSMDDVGMRANNPNRTMLGLSQLAWVERTLATAQQNRITWKIIAISSPIDELGQLGKITSTVDPTQSVTVVDSGKSWVGGYRAERNALLKYIADNSIRNVVFITTDDHLNRINEVAYFNDINNPTAGRVIVPDTLTIVAGPLGASGPNSITNHTFANLKSLADQIADAETLVGVNPLGLDPAFPGLQNVYREGDTSADSLRQPADFYSPDTFNYVTFEISADGQTLSVKTYGINSYPADTFAEPDLTNNPVRQILGFTLRAR
jgi:phosphodiesterase/alkaline phosphatase D-like protein